MRFLTNWPPRWMPMIYVKSSGLSGRSNREFQLDGSLSPPRPRLSETDILSLDLPVRASQTRAAKEDPQRFSRQSSVQ